MAFHTGLVSVSFRPYCVKDILRAAAAADLEWIEWGGDIHVPPKDAPRAREVAALTKAAGLRTIAYGSYFRLGQTPDADFPAYVETACTLGARVIRVWGGVHGSAEMPVAERAAVVEAAQKAAEACAEAELLLATEWHCGTVTDSLDSALRFFDEVNRPALRTLWQPNQFQTEADNLRAAAAVAPRVENLHVFQWDAHARYPLAVGERIWRQYLACFAKEADTREMGLLLEFMHDDRLGLDALPETAKTLQSWIGK